MNIKICDIEIGLHKPFVLIAGPCVIESEQLVLHTAKRLKEITQKLKIPFIFKTSFDKANRSAVNSFRGVGFKQGLAILAKVKEQLEVPILTDVHTNTPLDEVVEVVDVLQTAAFLCRQTDYLQRVASMGKPVNIKKGQFLAPWDMRNVVAKMRAVGNEQIMVCERGATFGYNRLVVDMRSLVIMRETKCPVIFDATHSVQEPGGLGNATGGQREFVPALARAAIAVGVAGLFLETHPEPDKALSDGPNMWPLGEMEGLLTVLQDLDMQVKSLLMSY